MSTFIKHSLALLLSLLLLACASSYQLSSNAQALRGQMTAFKAEKLLADYVQPTETRGGICMIGIQHITKLDYNQRATTSGSIIRFSAFYAALAGAKVYGNVMAGSAQATTTYESRRGNFSVDARTIKEIRVLETNERNLPRCQHAMPGYFVVLRKPESTLPDMAEITINVTTDSELDSILAALSYLAPQAKLVEGLGM